MVPRLYRVERFPYARPVKETSVPGTIFAMELGFLLNCEMIPDTSCVVVVMCFTEKLKYVSFMSGRPVISALRLMSDPVSV